MPSFDIVSEVDLQEVRNGVDQAVRELRNRFDFKNVDAGFALDDETILIHAPEDYQIAQLEDILRDKLAGRDIDGRCIEPGTIEGAGKVRRQRYALRQGIDRDTAKKLTKLTKDTKLKVQSQVNGEKVRITAKKRDDLQAIMAAVRKADLETPFQFDNFRD